MRVGVVLLRNIRLPIFLIALLLFLVAYPYFHIKFPKQIAVVELFFAMLMLSGVSILVSQKKLLIFMSFIAILILLGILLSGYTENHYILTTTMLTELVFFVCIFASLLNFIYSEEKVTLNKLYAAVTSYLVLGIIFALIYAIIAANFSDAFQYTVSNRPALAKLFPHPQFFSEALYFSFVTLSTLGYGDWAPMFGPIKMIASLEAIMGQLFIAILIARLVGIQISQFLYEKSLKHK